MPDVWKGKVRAMTTKIYIWKRHEIHTTATEKPWWLWASEDNHDWEWDGKHWWPSTCKTIGEHACVTERFLWNHYGIDEKLLQDNALIKLNVNHTPGYSAKSVTSITREELRYGQVKHTCPTCKESFSVNTLHHCKASEQQHHMEKMNQVAARWHGDTDFGIFAEAIRFLLEKARLK
jgi:hypothetical protein